MEVYAEPFGSLNGQTVNKYTLKNDHGLEISCLDFGCIITAIKAPDAEGTFENIVLGFDTLDDYLEHSPYFGAIIGRVAGRITGGSFTLNGKTYELAKNENGHHLHGGHRGFSHVLWRAEPIKKENEVGVIFTYNSPDGEEGYPGNLELSVTYLLNNRNELSIAYRGKSDARTLLNMTNHSYFNLSGELKRDILNHQLTIPSDHFLELNDELVPTGQCLNVENTPFDFRTGRKIADGTSSSHPQIALAGGGYDHPFLLQDRQVNLIDAESGRKLEIETDEPCVVLYTSNQLNGNFMVRNAKARKYLGVCLETQKPPDAIHHNDFPSVILEKGDVYQTKTTYRFTVTQ
ncbi:aldose epimerase family protein [Camelliibacillus cellulosilyticus]|uniref:Aldose 1-epimerase n=1 Tax=Camelliibacillus cellulosilyticus TaxID=2174486 RepID=A0ABV9GMY2_9BACL